MYVQHYINAIVLYHTVMYVYHYIYLTNITYMPSIINNVIYIKPFLLLI